MFHRFRTHTYKSEQQLQLYHFICAQDMISVSFFFAGLKVQLRLAVKSVLGR